MVGKDWCLSNEYGTDDLKESFIFFFEGRCLKY